MKLLTSVTGFISRHHGRGLSAAGSPRRVPPALRRKPIFETLESRILLSVDLVGIPDWIELGPGPMQSAQVNVPPGDFATGAVESIAINPNNTAQIYLGTVNGGVWRTNNADPTNPDATTWTPLTDLQASLAMGDIAFSPLDATGDTLFAGTGSYSSLGQAGGPPIGILRTTDGGATWDTFELNPGGAQNQVKAVVPTAIDLDPGAGVDEMVLVGTIGGGGLYRSDDNGETYALLSGANGLPAGDISQLIVDPNDAEQFYAGVPNQGVFRGDFDAGTGIITWTAVNTGITGIGTAGNVQIAGSDSGGTTVLFALLSGPSQGAFRSTDSGDNWTALATPPTLFQRDVTVRAGNTIIVDPTDDEVAYIATYGGGNEAFRYDPAGSGSWEVILGAGAQGGTAPHVDARDFAFQGNNVLLYASDGGIYFIENPLDSINNSWESYIGGGGTGLRSVEFHNIAWDGRFDVVVGGSQDNGTEVQLGTNNLVWDHFNGGDGGDVQVDAVSLAGANQSIRYLSIQDMDGLRRVVFDSATNIVQNVPILPGGGLANFTGTFVPHFELNVLDPAAMQSRSLVVGGGGTSPVYIATMPDAVNSNADVTWTAVPVAGGFGTVNALAFGGRSGAVDNPDVLYAGTENGVFVRSTAGGTLNPTATAFPGGGVADIALDPNDWQHAFVASSSGVWETTNAGATWTIRTGNLSNSNIRTIEFAEQGAVDAILVGGLAGVCRMITDDPGDWHEYGQFLPNAVVYDLDFDAGDNVLIAGTLGRGAWKITDASDTLTTPGLVRIDGDPDGDVIELLRRESAPWLLDVYFDGLLASTVLWDAIEAIEVNGAAGDDLLIANFLNGDVVPQDGIGYDGGIGDDELDIRNATFGSVTYVVSGPISGMVELGADDVIVYDFVQQVTDTTSATARVFTAAGTGEQTIRLVNDGIQLGVSRIDSGGAGDFAVHDFANPGASLAINAGAGNDDVQLLDVDALFAAAVALNGDAGDDAIVVNFGSGADLVNVNGGADLDDLLVNGTAAADSIAVTATQVTRGPETVNYQQIEDLAVASGGGEDDLLVLSTSTAGARLDAEEDSDDYSVNFGSLAGTVLVNDSGSLADTDTLLVNGTAGDDVLALAASSITRGAEMVNYFGIEELTLDAGNGNDTITVDGTGADTTVLGGDGDDDFIVNANGLFTLTLDGEEGSDSYEINLGALLGPVVIDDTGTTGTDTLLLNGTPFDDVIILTDTSISGLGDGSPFDLTFSGIEVLAVDAKAGDDIVDGSALTISVTLYGGDGDDLLIGGSNDDQIFGQGDNDDLIGNLGADLLDGGEGSDGILGDMGTIVRELVAGGGVATLLTTQNGRLEAYVDRPGTIRRNVTLIDADQGGDDTLIGGAGDDYLHGGAGDDALSGDEGIDALFGNDGDDTLAGGADDDHLYGGAGDDELDGNAGADIAYGGDGNDRLVADSSGDRLIDWFGNFNEFVVPGPGFGAPVIVRSPAPWVTEFLFVLARDDGALDADAELGIVTPGSSAQRSNSGKGG